LDVAHFMSLILVSRFSTVCYFYQEKWNN